MSARPGPGSLERPMEVGIGRVLGAGTVLAVALLAIGSALLLATGGSPLDAAPAFDPARLIGDLAHAQTAGFLWLGLVIVVATPAARVAAALVGYLGTRERGMATVAVLILAVIAAGVVAGMVRA